MVECNEELLWDFSPSAYALRPIFESKFGQKCHTLVTIKPIWLKCGIQRLRMYCQNTSHTQNSASYGSFSHTLGVWYFKDTNIPANYKPRNCLEKPGEIQCSARFFVIQSYLSSSSSDGILTASGCHVDIEVSNSAHVFCCGNH